MNDNKKKGSIIKNVFSVTGIVVVAKLLGFVKQMITAGKFGATIDTDLISLSQNLIGNLDYLLVQMFLTAFIPIYIGIKKEGTEKGNRFVTHSLIVWVLISSVLALILLVFTPIVAKIVAPSYTGELLSRLELYIRIYAPSILLIITCAVFNALLRANKRFIPGEMVSVIQSVTMILLVVFFGDAVGVKILIISYFVYSILNVFYLSFVSRKEWRFSFKKPLFDDNIKNLVSMCVPLLFGYSMIFVNQQVDAIICSGLGEGIVTAIGYAAVLTNLITTLIGSICSVLFTYVSQYTANGKEKEAAALIRQSAVLFTTALVPICTIIVMNAGDIVRIVYGRGAFSDEAVFNTSLALIGYGIAIVFYAYRELFSRLQYSYKDSRQPMINSTIGIVINILLSIILAKIMGILGITIASSIATIVCSILNVVTSRKHNPYVRVSATFRYMPFWIGGLIVCSAVSWFLGTQIGDDKYLIRFALTVIIAFAGYGLICLPVIKNNMDKVLNIIKRRVLPKNLCLKMP